MTLPFIAYYKQNKNLNKLDLNGFLDGSFDKLSE